MRRCTSRVFALTLLVVFASVATSSVAQEPSSRLSISASGHDGPVQVSVYLLVGSELPSDWVGWVVDRTEVGVCSPQTLQLGDVLLFPSGEQTFSLPDIGAEPGATYIYRFFAVDSVGNRVGLPHSLFSYSSSSAFGSVLNSGLVGVGHVVDFGWYAGIMSCHQECWGPLEGLEVQSLSFLAGFFLPIKVYGRVGVGVEGPYLEELASWETINSCVPVSTEGCSWGNLKAIYR